MAFNKKLRIVTDGSMTVLLFFLMGYHITGDWAHEVAGALMYLLFLVHNWLNWPWYRALLRGAYRPFRAFQTAVNLLLLANTLGLVVSGVMLSRYVFAFLPIRGGMAFARRLHMLTAYWGFILMAVHLGLHWGMVVGRLKGRGLLGPKRRWLQWFGWALAAWGLWAFFRRDFPSYLFLRILYSFWDYDQPLYLFLWDYLAIMALGVWLGYYATKGLQRWPSTKGAPKLQDDRKEGP